MSNASVIEKQKADVLIVCALIHEAKALIAHYGLKFVVGEYGFKLYANSQVNKNSARNDTANQQDALKVQLLVAGVGKVNMAAAMLWSNQYCSADCFINTGIVGHGSLSVGKSILINQVVDVSSGRGFYPSINFKWKGDFSALKTVDSPCDEYSESIAYDMEGSAFFDIANRFISNDKIHLLKIVSDNPQQSYLHVSKDSMQRYMQNALEGIDRLLSYIVIKKISYSMDIDAELAQMRQYWHVTTATESQLKEVLLASSVLYKNTSEKPNDWRLFNSPKEYIKESKYWLQTIKPKIL